MAHDVLGRPGSRLIPGAAAVLAPVRGWVTWWQVALALVDHSGVGSSAPAHLLASLRSLVRGQAGWLLGEARQTDFSCAGSRCPQGLDTFAAQIGEVTRWALASMSRCAVR